MECKELQTVLSGTEWYEAARDMQLWQWSLEEQVEHYSATLVSRVLIGLNTVQELRAGLAWVNALDAEAVEQGVAVTERDAASTEALARRIAHHSGRVALNAVKTRTRRHVEQAKRKAARRHSSANSRQQS